MNSNKNFAVVIVGMEAATALAADINRADGIGQKQESRLKPTRPAFVPF